MRLSIRLREHMGSIVDKPRGGINITNFDGTTKSFARWEMRAKSVAVFCGFLHTLEPTFLSKYPKSKAEILVPDNDECKPLLRARIYNAKMSALSVAAQTDNAVIHDIAMINKESVLLLGGLV